MNDENKTVAISPGNDPWKSVNDEMASDSTGWADFSSANFDNFERGFANRLAEEREKTRNEQKEQQQVVETDLKLESLETNSDITVRNEIEKVRSKTMESSAQIGKDSLEETILLEASGDQAKAEASIVPTIKEVPLIGATKEGDIAPVQTSSSHEISRNKTIDKSEANKEGV